ncbi:hypothetical protein F4779DRAFT_21157 [Xylariaceae sp. FL0662B]|nr:hypothetical protein F4779DRAFT_21157 [Xylariaceae sp. FL0662B]
MTVEFKISPEKEAGLPFYLHRQFFQKTPAISRDEVNLEGKTALVTGSNIGLGFECSRQLLDLGLSKLILAVRDESKGEAARKELISSSKSPGGSDASNTTVEVWKLDLSSYDSITSFAKRAEALERLDIAVLNAAVFKVPEKFHPSTGFEEDVQTNYLSNALLAILLLPALTKNTGAGGPGRLTIVSSDMAAWAKFPERYSRPLLPAFKKPAAKWDMGDRYATTKLLGQFFLTELSKRVPSSLAVVDAGNPGFCYGSGLQREGKGTLFGFAFGVFTRVIGRPCHIGARALVDAAVRHGEEAHGQYVEDGEIRPMAPIIYKPEGEEIAKLLWKETMDELSFAGVEDIIGQFSR